MKKLLRLFFFVLFTSLLITGCSKDDDNGATATVIDADGNVYHTIKIGTQTWMAENLRTTKYNDGTAIPLVTDSTSWWKLTTPGYCWGNNAATYKNLYGAFYNWYTVNTGKLAPTGWHVPTDAEWTILENYLTVNGYSYDGSLDNFIAKSLAATTNWVTYTVVGTIGNDLSKNNRSGFTALPGSCRRYAYGGVPGENYEILFVPGYIGCWWTSNEAFPSEDFPADAWYRCLSYNLATLFRSSFSTDFGISVRCVKDN